MEATRKLYYEDVMRRSFCATVLACEQAGPAFRVALDATIFYPEGGGQPADHGALGGARVVDVHEQGNIIWHTVTAPLAVGETVQGDLDWKRRFDLMQQHTGEHIVSGLIHAQFGYDNVGFHIGSDTVTVDFSGPLTAEDLLSVEQAANWAVWNNEPITVSWPTPTELSHLAYRSKKELTGAVRIVTVGQSDCCACCGTHVRTCSEVGIIKLLAAQSYKGGTRVTMVSGIRAWRDYCQKCESTAAVSVLLSAKPAEISTAVARLHAENAALKEKNAALEARLCTAAADIAAENGEPVLVLPEALSPDGVRRQCLALCTAFAQRQPDIETVCAVFAPQESGEETAAVQRAAESGQARLFSYAVSGTAPSIDVRPFGQRMNAALQGRGGGKPNLVQGTVQCSRAAIDAFFKAP